MTTFYMSINAGILEIASDVVEGTSPPTASVAVEINTTAFPTLGYADCLAMLQTIENYIRTDSNAPAGTSVLALAKP